jgi:hypothetical protein
MALPRFTKWGPAADYRGAHVVDMGGRLATIVDIYRDDVRGVLLARLRRFDGSDAGTQTLATLEIIERTYDNGEDA